MAVEAVSRGLEMKVELVQLAGRDGDTAYNLQRTIEAIYASARTGGWTRLG